MTDRYINLFTDYGFKKIFGEEPNKDLLIGFLNELLPPEARVTDLTYLKNERLGLNEGERRAVYDLYCTNETGEKFIVEVQRVRQQFFKDRSLYYSTFAIQEQAARGKDWQYELKAVYTVAVLDFTFEDTGPEALKHVIGLVDLHTCKVFNKNLTFIYLEIPKFNKPLQELATDYERWLFAFKNLHKLADRPEQLQEGIFKRLLEVAEIARLDRNELAVYQDSLKDYRDLKSAMDTYFAEGKEEGLLEGKKEGLLEGKKEGLLEGKKEVARNLLKNGMDIDSVALATGLDRAVLQEISQNL